VQRNGAAHYLYAQRTSSYCVNEKYNLHLVINMKELTVLQTATDDDSRFGSGGRAGELRESPLYFVKKNTGGIHI